MVVPTDRRLEPEDVPALRDIGIHNVLIGYAATGNTDDSIVRATTRFRSALDGR